MPESSEETTSPEDGNRLSNQSSAKTGIVMVDHGSRRDESNQMFLQLVEAFKKSGNFEIVEAAHMELAQPTIAEAYASCVEQGAEQIVVHPYFLFPGRHWDVDIPNLVARAAKEFPTIPYKITRPLEIHRSLFEVINERISESLDS